MTCIAARPGSDNAVATGSLDGSVRFWDLRSPLPLAVLEAHKEKVLALAWRDGARLVSGGSDSMLHMFNAPLPGASLHEG
jgi:WD40 repeat protein